MPLARNSAAACSLSGPAYASGVKSIFSGASMSMTSVRSTIFIARAEYFGAFAPNAR